MTQDSGEPWARSPEEAERWEHDQNDPDNWFQIPEFGIRPLDVAFSGFALPIVHPRAESRTLSGNIRQLVRLARQRARKEFDSLRQLQEANLQALDILEPHILGVGEQSKRPFHLTDAQRSAALYALIMHSLQRAAEHAMVGKARDALARLEALAEACAMLGNWLAGTTDSQASAIVDARRLVSDRARAAAGSRYHLDRDGKQEARRFVHECWQDWHEGRTRYKSASAFARDMLDKQPGLTSETVVTRWVRKWRKSAI